MIPSKAVIPSTELKANHLAHGHTVEVSAPSGKVLRVRKAHRSQGGYVIVDLRQPIMEKTFHDTIDALRRDLEGR